jgi:hypothetical protein
LHDPIKKTTLKSILNQEGVSLEDFLENLLKSKKLISDRITGSTGYDFSHKSCKSCRSGLKKIKFSYICHQSREKPEHGARG